MNSDRKNYIQLKYYKNKPYWFANDFTIINNNRLINVKQISEMHKYAVKYNIDDDKYKVIVIEYSLYLKYIEENQKEYLNILQDTEIFIQELKALKQEEKTSSIVKKIDYKNEIYSLIIQNNNTGSIENYENIFNYIREEKLEDFLNVKNIANAIFINKHLDYFKNKK